MHVEQPARSHEASISASSPTQNTSEGVVLPVPAVTSDSLQRSEQPEVPVSSIASAPITIATSGAAEQHFTHVISNSIENTEPQSVPPTASAKKSTDMVSSPVMPTPESIFPSDSVPTEGLKHPPSNVSDTAQITSAESVQGANQRADREIEPHVQLAEQAEQEEKFAKVADEKVMEEKGREFIPKSVLVSEIAACSALVDMAMEVDAAVAFLVYYVILNHLLFHRLVLV
jgi:hypothetical protein